MSRNDFKNISNVSIDDVLLDVTNPRIRTGSSQQDCINRVLRKEDQMLSLIKSIAKDGLTTMPILVSPHESEANKWVVKDGNRRITALKLLNNPEFCKDGALKTKIESLIITHSENIPSAIDCMSSSNSDAIMNEVLARHSGAMSGAGHYDWTAYLRTVFLLNNAQISEYKRAGQYIFWAEKQSIFIDDDFPISNINRLISNPVNLNLTGFKADDNNLILIISEDKAKRIANKIIYDFGNALVTVNDIFTIPLATAYLKNVLKELGITIEEQAKDTEPNSSNSSNDNNSNNTQQSDSGTTNNSTEGNEESSDEKPGENNPAATPRPRSNNKPAWDRKKLFHRGAPAPSIPITEIKARTFVYEIKQLDIQDTPLAVTMLLRGLIELSVNNYVKQHNLRSKDKLAQNLSTCADSMLSKSLINQSQLELLKTYSVTDKNQVGIFNIDTLQKYLHRETHHPNSQTLNTFWDEIAHFINMCWST